jgi:hypothetical protein
MVGRAGRNAFGSVQAVMLKTHVPRPQPELSETARKKPELELLNMMSEISRLYNRTVTVTVTDYLFFYNCL